MNSTEIRKALYSMRDEKYAAFQAKLIPGMDAEKMIGVRTPALRSFAKELYKDPNVNEFLIALPHDTFDENQLHAFILSEEKDFERCVQSVDAFLPYVDNWATCDQLSPKVFKKHPEKLLPYIRRWITSTHTYTVRFAIGMLMQYFLDDRFSTEYADLAASLRSDEYYINMMIAWYFATALAKQYDAILPYIEEKRLDKWTHNKAIQKSVESFRITPDQKEYLKTLKIK